MEKSQEVVRARLAKAIGHLESVLRMVDNKRYCMDVLQQLTAVQAALNRIAEIILRQHLESCLVNAMQNHDTEQVITELIQVFRKAPDIASVTAKSLIGTSETGNVVPTLPGALAKMHDGQTMENCNDHS